MDDTLPPPYEAKDVYLKRGDDVLGLHAIGDSTTEGWHQYECWVNLYSPDFGFLGSIYRVFRSIDEEVAELKNEGWIEVKRPAEVKA